MSTKEACDFQYFLDSLSQENWYEKSSPPPPPYTSLFREYMFQRGIKETQIMEKFLEACLYHGLSIDIWKQVCVPNLVPKILLKCSKDVFFVLIRYFFRLYQYFIKPCGQFA